MDQGRPRSVKLTDPRALRAYAHPTRMALVALLRLHGPQTATKAAGAIGESVASCSFHLRQMAKYGLVEQAAGGHGREKPWKATAAFTEWDSDDAKGPAAAAAVQALQLALAGQYHELAARWVQEQSGEPASWREAAHFGDTFLHLTARELKDLSRKVDQLVEPYLERSDDASVRPAASRPVMFVHLAFPMLLTGHDGRLDSDR
jgi:predicted ArsR family transcriptional regulator